MSTFDYWDLATGEGLTDHDLHERFDDMLDEVYGSVEVVGIDYFVSSVLKDSDPIRYRCEFNDWLDSELGETLTDEEPEDKDWWQVSDMWGNTAEVIASNEIDALYYADLSGYLSGDASAWTAVKA